jgi:predicted DCC family thiol-disulfide oxidoreductase YuxK
MRKKGEGVSRNESQETEEWVTRFKSALGEGKVFVFFDGQCMLCNRFAAWVVSNDPQGRVFFAPIQGSLAALILEADERAQISSVIVVTKEGKFQESEALAEVLSILPGWQIWAEPLRLVPLRLRDFVYKFVARNRKKWFGESPECPMPFREQAHRLWK